MCAHFGAFSTLLTNDEKKLQLAILRKKNITLIYNGKVGDVHKFAPTYFFWLFLAMMCIDARASI